ncbi:tyrosine/serine/threonine protein phosphatase pps1 [Lecanora helva]
MSTVLIHQPAPRSLTPPSSPSLELDSARPSTAPIPNKHLPFCPTGPVPTTSQQTPTPPASPPTKHAGLQTFSLLHPAETYAKIVDRPPIYSINASTLAAAINELARQPFPDPKLVFPWLHGLHAENQVQLAFFIARRRSLRNTPKCFRGITIVKVGGDLSTSKLKGAIGEDEALDSSRGQDSSFLDVDPRDGFSVRNFQIQASKMATVSDVVIYGDDSAKEEDIRNLASRFAFAQDTWRVQNAAGEAETPRFNTFILTSSFKEIEAEHPDLVAIDSQGLTKGNVMDFCEF